MSDSCTELWKVAKWDMRPVGFMHKKVNWDNEACQVHVRAEKLQ